MISAAAYDFRGSFTYRVASDGMIALMMVPGSDLQRYTSIEATQGPNRHARRFVGVWFPVVGRQDPGDRNRHDLCRDQEIFERRCAPIRLPWHRNRTAPVMVTAVRRGFRAVARSPVGRRARGLGHRRPAGRNLSYRQAVVGAGEAASCPTSAATLPYLCPEVGHEKPTVFEKLRRGVAFGASMQSIAILKINREEGSRNALCETAP
jgi:hypothetical protein